MEQDISPGNLVRVASLNDPNIHTEYVVETIIPDRGIFVTTISGDVESATRRELFQDRDGIWRMRGLRTPHNVEFFAERTFTSVPDADEMILMLMSGRDILSMCTTNKYFSSICNRDIFWRKKIRQEYGVEILNLKPEKESWIDYYKKLSDFSYSLIDMCIDGNFRPCRRDQFWRVKVVQLFGERVAQLNRHAPPEGGAKRFSQLPHFRQYETLLPWLIRRSEPDEDDVPPIDEETILSLARKFNDRNPDFVEADVLYWLMTFPEYRSMMINMLPQMAEDAMKRKVYHANYLSLLTFLIQEGFLNVEENRDILQTYAELAVESGPRFYVPLIESGLLTQLDHNAIALSAARDQNIDVLREMHHLGFNVLTPEIHQVLRGPGDTFYYALDSGDIETLRFAYQLLGARPNDESLNQAIIHENLELLREVYDMGARPTIQSFVIALQNDSPEDILEFLWDINAPTENINPQNITASRLHPRNVDWLLRKGLSRTFRGALQDALREPR